MFRVSEFLGFLWQFYFTVNIDRMANSADPDQIDSMLKSHYSNFRIINTVIFFECPNFSNFYEFQDTFVIFFR